MALISISPSGDSRSQPRVGGHYWILGSYAKQRGED